MKPCTSERSSFGSEAEARLAGPFLARPSSFDMACLFLGDAEFCGRLRGLWRNERGEFSRTSIRHLEQVTLATLPHLGTVTPLRVFTELALQKIASLTKWISTLCILLIVFRAMTMFKWTRSRESRVRAAVGGAEVTSRYQKSSKTVEALREFEPSPPLPEKRRAQTTH